MPPGCGPRAGFTARGGHIVCTYFDENFLNMVPAAHVEGLYSCLDYYQTLSDPFSQKLLAQYDALLASKPYGYEFRQGEATGPKLAPLGDGSAVTYVTLWDGAIRVQTPALKRAYAKLCVCSQNELFERYCTAVVAP